MCSLLGYGYGVEQSKPSPNSICFSIFSILASILCSVNLDDISCESVRASTDAFVTASPGCLICPRNAQGAQLRQRQTWWMQGSKVVAWQTRTVTDA
uniref:Uncharacterized protein n=1 Tax=Oryza rufipogon TaxID=4529 RepID=A0A0E0NEC5_ORYRU